MTIQHPVVVVPGITASVLEDVYPVEPERVWNASTKRSYERITLHPDDLRYEARGPARVAAGSPIHLAYGDLVDALRHDLSKKVDKPTPVFPFGYDWRRDCFASARQLGDMIEEVIARTSLLPHYRKEPPQRVDLVAHSMGGLVVAAYLRGKQTGERGFSRGDSRVRRVVSIGTPFRGSVDAIHKLSTGMGSLTGPAPRDREREAARMMPALYQLLPTFPECATLVGMPAKTVDLFQADNWQKSVVATMKEFIRLVGSNREPKALLQQFLDDAAGLIAAVNELDLTGNDVLPDGVDGWLPIVGIGAKTLERIEVDLDGPRFRLLDAPEVAANDPATGDGTVPFRGAQPNFLPRERLIGVSPEDFSMWEVADRALLRLAGFHAMLPNLNLVQRLTIRHLRDDYRGELWGHVVPGVSLGEQVWPEWLTGVAKEP